MKLKGHGWRGGWRRAALVGGLFASAWLASCGGGEQVQTFRATRVIAFGDESSAIDTNGRKYTVNAIASDTGAIDCANNPIWVQYVAGLYGLVFPQCNVNGELSPTSLIYAVPDALVADLAIQVDQQLNNDGFGSTDLVTILIGSHDILNLYAQFPGLGQDELVATAQQLGITLAAQVNRVADLGGKVLISTIPDLGLTPFAVKEEQANPGRAAVLSTLSLAFNTALRANILNDGRKIGLVLLDERLTLFARSPASFGLVNITQGACSVTLPNCSTLTLVADPASVNGVADGSTWLWADDTHLSAGGQLTLGQLAGQRAQGNPF